MALEASHVIAMIIVLFGYITLFFSFYQNAKMKLFFLGYSALAIGSIAATISAVDGFDFLRLAEHIIGVAGGGILLAYWAFKHFKQDQFLRRKLEEMDR